MNIEQQTGNCYLQRFNATELRPFPTAPIKPYRKCSVRPEDPIISNGLIETSSLSHPQHLIAFN